MLGKNKGVSVAQTLVAANARITGDIHFTGGLHLQGHVCGNLVAGPEGGELVIGEGGVVEGEIHAPNVVINGEVRGNVFSTARLQLASRAVVTGNVHYRLIEVVFGARIDGSLQFSGDLPPNT